NRPDGHQSLMWARLRLALAQYLRLRVDGVALEERRRHTNLVPAQVHRVLRDIGDGKAGDQRKRERRVDERPPPLGLRRIVCVEVDRVGVLRQQRKPGVIGRRHGTADRVAIDIADLKIFVAAPIGHASPPWLWMSRLRSATTRASRRLTASTIFPSTLTAPR